MFLHQSREFIQGDGFPQRQFQWLEDLELFHIVRQIPAGKSLWICWCPANSRNSSIRALTSYLSFFLPPSDAVESTPPLPADTPPSFFRNRNAQIFWACITASQKSRSSGTLLCIDEFCFISSEHTGSQYVGDPFFAFMMILRIERSCRKINNLSWKDPIFFRQHVFRLDFFKDRLCFAPDQPHRQPCRLSAAFKDSFEMGMIPRIWW